MKTNLLVQLLEFLTTSDSDNGDSHTYSLVSGSGDTDNASFSISGANLLSAESFDYETKTSYSIRSKPQMEPLRILKPLLFQL